MIGTHDQYARFTLTLLLAIAVWAWPQRPAVAQPVPGAPPAIGAAFVISTDFSTGSYSVIDLATLTTFNDINLGGIHSDALARYDPITGRVYVVNRLGADSIQVIDPQQGYITPPGAELSVGNGSNPQDIVVLSPDKAYVSRANTAELLIINPTTLTELGTVDLSSLTLPTDLDGLPDAHMMLLHAGLLYVVLQNFDQTNRFQPAGPGAVGVIDTATDTIAGVITLQTPNPSKLQFTAALLRGPRLLVSVTGDTFGVDNGGIEAIDLATQTVDPTLVVDEGTLGGGTISHFEVVSATKGYAIVSFFAEDGTFGNALVSFNPTTGERLGTLADNLPATPNFAISNAGQLYLGPTDMATLTPGVRIFDTALDVELTAAPLSVGALPPNLIVMIEAPQVALTVHKAGAGDGIIIATPEGMNCGTVCTYRYAAGTMVTLTATPAEGSTFTGWQGGGCSGVTPCMILLEQELAVSATFELVAN